MRDMYELSHRMGLETPVRNHYFYGQLLGVRNFEVQTEYFNQKRWLINRLVLGYGVVCGLNVERGRDDDTIIITPGVALDGWGREIIVPDETRPISLPCGGPRHKPERPGGGKDGGGSPDRGRYDPEQEDSPNRGRYDPKQEDSPNRGRYDPKQEGGPEEQYEQKPPPRPTEEFDVHVVICYHECETDPVPVRAGDCATADPCVPGSIREQYRIHVKDGALEPPDYTGCDIPDFISGGNVDYHALVNWVSGGCGPVSGDLCVPLANIRVVVDEEGKRCYADEIDITVRPIVYSNDLLCRMIQSLLVEPRRYRRGR